MGRTIGIRREDKNPWERRVPLIPEQVEKLIRDHDLGAVVQSSPIRAYPDPDYLGAGARIDEDLSDCAVVMAVKEIPIDFFLPGRTYVFFSHTLKGQSYNMPMLKRMMELGCNLIDYEGITDEKGRRLVLFGRFAGLAGMIDALWALGRRSEHEGVRSPLCRVRRATEYATLDEAKEDLASIGEDLAGEGLPESSAPLVVGFAGYGNVSAGAQEIFDLFPHKEVPPEDLEGLHERGGSNKALYKVVFREQHTVEPQKEGAAFDLKEFFSHPERYRSRFDRYLPFLTVLMNCVYWKPGSPRLVTRQALRTLFEQEKATPRLRVIGDISCDINGAVECTSRCTDPGNPVYVYDPLEETTTDGVAGRGPVILAVDNLPCELPVESSRAFGEALAPFVPAVAEADYEADLEDTGLPPQILRAVILHRGRLTTKYAHLAEHLEG